MLHILTRAAIYDRSVLDIEYRRGASHFARDLSRAARELSLSTMMKTAITRTDPADILNAAVDALIPHRFELPAITALRRLAGTAHRRVNAEPWNAVCTQLEESKRTGLEALSLSLILANNAKVPVGVKPFVIDRY